MTQPLWIVRHSWNKALLDFHLWNAVKRKSKWAGGWRCETFNGQTLREMECTPSFSYSKALCLSSLLLSDFRTLTSGKLSHTISYIFSQSNYLLNSMTKDTMDSHIHSVLACSLKKEEHCTKQRWSDLFFNFQIHSRVLWLEKEHSEILSFAFHAQKETFKRHRPVSFPVC